MAEQSSNSGSDELGLAHYLEVFRRQRFAMTTTVWLVCVTMIAFVYLRPEKYISTAQMLFEPALQESIFDPGPSAPENRDIDRIANELVILRSQGVREAVKKSLGWPASRPSSSLADFVAIRRLPDTSIVSLTATASSPQEAHNIAQKYTDSYIQLRKDQRLASLKAASDQVQSELEEVRKHLTEVEAPITELDGRVIATIDTATRARLIDQRDELVRRTEPQRASLQARYAELDNVSKELAIAAKVTSSAGIQLISTPELPTTPAGLDIRKAMVAAIGLGVLLAVVIAFLREAMRRDLPETTNEVNARYLPARSARKHRTIGHNWGRFSRRSTNPTRTEPPIDYVPEPED